MHSSSIVAWNVKRIIYRTVILVIVVVQSVRKSMHQFMEHA